MFTGHSGERGGSTVHLDPADISRLAAEARRIATEEALAARSPLLGPAAHEADRGARSEHSAAEYGTRSDHSGTDRISSSERSVRSDQTADQQPEVAIIDTDRPTPSYSAAAPRWKANTTAQTLPSEQQTVPSEHTATSKDDTKLSTREAAMKILEDNAKKHRRIPKAFDGQVDDGIYRLHSLRFAPAPHIHPGDFYNLGIQRHRASPQPAFIHDMSHIKNGLMLNPRAYILANSITDTTLPLETFRPGTLSIPESDRPIADMRETQKAFSIFCALVRRAKPWDCSWEVVLDFLIEVEWFQVLERPICGFYRKPSYPAYKASADLIVAINRSVTQLLPIQQVMLDQAEVRRIHTQRCSESPENWGHTPQAASSSQQQPPRPDKSSSSRRPKLMNITTTKEQRAKIKAACAKTKDPICIAYNLGRCIRPLSGSGCAFMKTGVLTQLEHSCAFVDAKGTRCKQLHPMAASH